MKKPRDLTASVLNNPIYFWSLVALVFVISRLATWFYPFDSDHWIFYYVGKIWAQGGTLYVSAWDHKPPLVFVHNALMYWLFGGNIVWHRIWLTLLSIVDIGMFYVLLKRVLPQIQKQAQDDVVNFWTKIGLLLYVFWRNLSQFTSSGNNTENLGLIFFLGMILSYLSFRKEQKWWKMLISGICFSILFFLKGNFLLLGIPIGVILLIDNWKKIRNFFGYGLLFALPFVVQAGFWVYYFASKQALSDFFIASFLFSAKYSKSAWSGDVSNNIILLLTLVVFLLPMLLFFGVYLWDFKNNIKNNQYLFVGMSFLAGLALTIGVGSFYPYYFLIFMPISVLLMVYSLNRANDLNKYLRWFLYLAFAGSMLLSFGISMKQFYNSFAGSVKAEAAEYQQIADYVKANTTSSDKVFAYDYGATFYRLADRDSGSRFVSASVLLLENRDNYGYDFDGKFILDMEASKAKYVVVYKDKSNIYYQNERLTSYFDSRYELDKTFMKFKVLKRK